MFFAFHLPIGDFRPFVESAPPRLPAPFWPIPEPYREFVRSFGSIVKRRNDMTESGLRGNDFYFCNSRRALRLEGLRWDGPAALEHLEIYKIFRHFVTDAELVTRFDLCIEGEYSNYDVSDELVPDIFEFLRMSVRVPLQRRPKQFVPLHRIGKRLAALYARTSISHSSKEQVNISRSLIIPETPIVVVESPEMPTKMGRIRTYRRGILGNPEKETELEYTHFTGNLGNKAMPVWIIKAKGKNQKISRMLHAGIVKIYTEYSILRRMLQLMRNGIIKYQAGTEHGERIEAYLNAATSKIGKRFMFNCDQESMRLIMELYEVGVSADELEQYATVLGEMRRQVKIKAQNFILGNLSGAGGVATKQGGMTTVHNVIIFGDNNRFEGDIAAGNIIKDSYNSASASENQMLTFCLTELVILVAQLAEKMPDMAEQRRTSSKVKALVEEAKSPKPDHEFLKVTAKGLLEAAKTVAEMVGPITTSVKALMGLFGIRL